MNNQQDETKPRFVTASELANEIGVTIATLSRWVKAGKFPAPLRVGLRKRVWLRVAVERHILNKN